MATQNTVSAREDVRTVPVRFDSDRFAVMQWPEWLTLDGIAPARAIGVPTVMIHSDGAALPENVRRFHAALSGPKTLCWMKGEHTQFYDHEPHVTYAARAAAGHLRTALGEGQA